MAMELGAVGRALCLMETLSKEKHMNLETISAKSELPKATALRILADLVEKGYVRRDEFDRYSLTLKMFSVGSGAVSNMDMMDCIRIGAERLSSLFEETVHVGILEDKQAVYIHKKESSYTIRMYSRVGKRIPLYCTAIGKCLLAGMNDNDLNSYLAQTELRKFTMHTISDASLLKKEILNVREKGFSTDCEEHEEGIICIAAPIRDYSGQTVASMSVSWPKFRLDDIPAKTQAIVRECSEISTMLGFQA